MAATLAIDLTTMLKWPGRAQLARLSYEVRLGLNLQETNKLSIRVRGNLLIRLCLDPWKSLKIREAKACLSSINFA